MREVDTQRQLQAQEDEERAHVAFAGADGGRQQGKPLGIEGPEGNQTDGERGTRC